MPYNPNSNNQIINFLCNHSKIDPQHEASGHLHGDPGLVSATADQTLMEYTGGWHPHLPTPTPPTPTYLFTFPSYLPFSPSLPTYLYLSILLPVVVVVVVIGGYLNVAQWLYLARLPSPHDDADWSSWYLSKGR